VAVSPRRIGNIVAALSLPALLFDRGSRRVLSVARAFSVISCGRAPPDSLDELGRYFAIMKPGTWVQRIDADWGDAVATGPVLCLRGTACWDGYLAIQFDLPWAASAALALLVFQPCPTPWLRAFGVGAREAAVAEAAQGVPGDLSAREREILALMLQGQSTKAISRQLQLSTSTVASHRASMRIKLGARNSCELAVAVLTRAVHAGADSDSLNSSQHRATRGPKD
jgi:DNA-binding CsgD family transcriptional regulator